MQYTVHKILSMIKTTRARIDKELSDTDFSWIEVAQGQEDNISGVPVKKIQSEIQSRYDRIVSLIENYIKLKSAVIRSNTGVRGEVELHRVLVAGKNLTVAEIIDLQENVYGRTKNSGFKSALFAKMKSDYAKAQARFDDLKARADEAIEHRVRLILGQKKDDATPVAETNSVIEAASKMLHEQRDPRLIDPLKLADKIAALQNEIEVFRTEADAALSEQNALTIVELDLTEIN